MCQGQVGACRCGYNLFTKRSGSAGAGGWDGPAARSPEEGGQQMHRLMLRSEGTEPDPLVADLATGTVQLLYKSSENKFLFNYSN